MISLVMILIERVLDTPLLQGQQRCPFIVVELLYSKRRQRLYFLKDFQIYKGKDKIKNTVNGTQIH